MITTMKQTNHITMDGTIINAMGYENFRVRMENDVEILATPSGKLRLYHVKIMPGDKVKVELSPYDLTRGRITYRYKQ